MKKIVTVDGNEACALASISFTEVAGIYPITPSSPMAEHLDEWKDDKKNIFGSNVRVVEMQSEAGAAGMIHGALTSGSLATTFTASQGLLLMIPNMYKMAGEMLPCVMHVAARSLSTHALSIFGDHQDVYATRSTGFCMLASSSVQDAYFLALVTHLSAIKASLPFMHFFDGFRTSHEINKIEILEENDYKHLIDKEALQKFRQKAINPLNPNTRGTNQNDDVYFQATEARNKDYENVVDIVNNYMQEINKIASTNYQPFNYYGSKSAKNIIVAMGSVCETIKETIDELNNDDYGLIEVHLYRPFSVKYLLNVLPDTALNIAVLDRSKEPTSREPLYLDIVEALKDKNINIVGGRYGLSSKNTTPAQIKAVFNMLDSKLKDNFTIGIKDDVTNLSLEVDDFKIKTSREMLIYGYGSDGMVSASKTIMKLVGDNTNNYVQGYFQYDSKKSGGVTISNLRFSDKKIRSTYYCENPFVVVVSKDSYLEMDVLENIVDNGIFLLNTSKDENEINSILTNTQKKIINERNVKFYTIDASLLARKVNLGNKISTIMESATIYLSNIIDYDFALEKIKKSVIDKFSKKSMDIVNANIEAIDLAKSYIKEIKIDSNYSKEDLKENEEVINMMLKRKGNELPVSAFTDYKEGIFPSGTSKISSSPISDIVPFWVNTNCIQCNMCSFYCPHNVIKPYLLNEEEYQKAPDIIKQKCIKPIDKNYQDHYYVIGINPSKCTGCMVCVKNCPGKLGEKALITESTINQIRNKEQEINDYLEKNVSEKNVDVNTVKNTQFRKSGISYPGACAGCGQPAYIKLLTQLFGKSIVIANATGCSSIYGASAPIMPYNVPWASSLFEDNAEYGFGIHSGYLAQREKLENLFKNEENPLIKKWLENKDNYEITKEVYDNLDYDKINPEIKELKDYIIKRSTWIIGGDGWAYDIGFSGIDHVIAQNENVNILVLDTQVYSNTGGQASKASPKGVIASFATKGKQQSKKDLARICLAYPNVYVAQVSLGANPNQLLKAFKEANEYNGPSIILAYTPCISHGIKGGMVNSIDNEKLAVNSGYYPIFRYNPVIDKFTLDSKNVNFDLYEEFLNSQTRYKMLEAVNKEQKDILLNQNKMEAIKRYDYYKSLEKSE